VWKKGYNIFEAMMKPYK
jgi:hypothetical protein